MVCDLNGNENFFSFTVQQKDSGGKSSSQPARGEREAFISDSKVNHPATASSINPDPLFILQHFP